MSFATQLKNTLRQHPRLHESTHRIRWKIYDAYDTCARRIYSPFAAKERERIMNGGPVPRLALPHFLCIGAQKAGTTWLYENLRVHPQIAVSPRKEEHYFDLRYHRGLKYYAAQFSGPPEAMRGD